MYRRSDCTEVRCTGGQIVPRLDVPEVRLYEVRCTGGQIVRGWMYRRSDCTRLDVPEVDVLRSDCSEVYALTSLSQINP